MDVRFKPRTVLMWLLLSVVITLIVIFSGKTAFGRSHAEFMAAAFTGGLVSSAVSIYFVVKSQYNKGQTYRQRMKTLLAIHAGSLLGAGVVLFVFATQDVLSNDAKVALAAILLMTVGLSLVSLLAILVLWIQTFVERRNQEHFKPFN